MAKLSIDKNTEQVEVEVEGNGIEVLALLTMLTIEVLGSFEKDGIEREEVWDDINKTIEATDYGRKKE